MNLLDLLFPPRCLSCRSLSRMSLCRGCESKWPRLPLASCSSCLCPFDAPETGSHLCAACLAEERSCGRLFAAGLYRGVLLDLIVRFKYRYEERLAPFLGVRMTESVQGNSREDYDLLLPIPLHRGRLRGRGYNQSLLLARDMGRRLGKPVDPFLLRKRFATPPQAGLSREERMKNVRKSFEVRESEKIVKKKVLLVDDVYTTGATVEQAARVLRNAGASSVDAAVVARAE